MANTSTEAPEFDAKEYLHGIENNESKLEDLKRAMQFVIEIEHCKKRNDTKNEAYYQECLQKCSPELVRRAVSLPKIHTGKAWEAVRARLQTFEQSMVMYGVFQ